MKDSHPGAEEGMTDHARGLMIAKLHVLLQRSLVEIRNLALCEAHGQVHDLADAVESLPSLVLRWDDEQASLVRPALHQYGSKYTGSADRYTCILDMEEQEFNRLYRPERYCWDVEAAQDPTTAP
jgi:hypothetical protein